MKQVLRTAIAGLAFGLAAPLAAQDTVTAAAADPAAEELVFLSEEEEELQALEQEITDAFSLVGEAFKVDPLTAEQQARVPLAMEMANAIMPEGSFGVAVNDTIEPIMAMLGDAEMSDPRVRLAEISGVEPDDLTALTDESAQEALDIFDPSYAERNQRTSDTMVTLIRKLMDAVEPAYRQGMAQALAVRFEEAEMRELLAFFATPVGAKFAQQSFQVQHDPRLLGVMETMGPAFAKMIPEMVDELTTIETELGLARDFTELSTAERSRAARLIGKSVSELEALVPEVTEETEAGEEPVA